VAVPLPGDVIDLVARAQKGVGQERRMRLVPVGQMHCTLAFMGAVDQDGVESARRAVIGIPAGSGGHAYTGGMLLLPNARRARVVALGLDDCEGTLDRLHARVVSDLESAGLISAGRKPFRAHVTLARVKDPGPVQLMAECERIRFGVESVCLYESELRREGPVYSVLERVDLQRAPEREKA